MSDTGNDQLFPLQSINTAIHYNGNDRFVTSFAFSAFHISFFIFSELILGEIPWDLNEIKCAAFLLLDETFSNCLQKCLSVQFCICNSDVLYKFN